MLFFLHLIQSKYYQKGNFNMARKKQSTAEDMIDIVAVLPWWVGVTLAIVSYFILHDIATQVVVIKSGSPNHIDQIGSQLYKTLATFGQYIFPMIFSFGAIASLLRRKQRTDLLSSVKTIKGKDVVRKMNWKEFELLVGEAFRQQGFTVAETGSGADGGIDLIAKKEGATYLIQCKHWKKSKIGVSIIREHLGVIVSEGAAGGFVVTSGVYTQEAKGFAQSNNIKLLDGDTLYQSINATQQPIPTQQKSEPIKTNQPEVNETPSCPICQQAMVMRTAKKGSNVGNNFWGCSQFPKCRGVASI